MAGHTHGSGCVRLGSHPRAAGPVQTHRECRAGRPRRRCWRQRGPGSRWRRRSSAMQGRRTKGSARNGRLTSSALRRRCARIACSSGLAPIATPTPPATTARTDGIVTPRSVDPASGVSSDVHETATTRNRARRSHPPIRAPRGGRRRDRKQEGVDRGILASGPKTSSSTPDATSTSSSRQPNRATAPSRTGLSTPLRTAMKGGPRVRIPPPPLTSRNARCCGHFACRPAPSNWRPVGRRGPGHLRRAPAANSAERPSSSYGTRGGSIRRGGGRYSVPWRYSNSTRHWTAWPGRQLGGKAPYADVWPSSLRPRRGVRSAPRTLRRSAGA